MGQILAFSASDPRKVKLEYYANTQGSCTSSKKLACQHPQKSRAGLDAAGHLWSGMENALAICKLTMFSKMSTRLHTHDKLLVVQPIWMPVYKPHSTHAQHHQDQNQMRTPGLTTLSLPSEALKTDKRPQKHFGTAHRGWNRHRMYTTARPTPQPPKNPELPIVTLRAGLVSHIWLISICLRLSEIVWHGNCPNSNRYSPKLKTVAVSILHCHGPTSNQTLDCGLLDWTYLILDATD